MVSGLNVALKALENFSFISTGNVFIASVFVDPKWLHFHGDFKCAAENVGSWGHPHHE